LTSHDAQQVIRDLPEIQPTFFAELTQPHCCYKMLILNDDEAEEEDNTLEDINGDSEVPLAALLDHIHNPSQGSHSYKTDDDGRLVPVVEAEQAFIKETGEISVEQAEAEAEEDQPPTQALISVFMQVPN
jgi:hypothetical protein